ncbi:MAG: fatty acid cis/trans isomerase [Haliea sp.]|uniref:fatty acid cis/trans isomerase n=1 Tax=Haliea sp. TaxID=1932666 RepID=UPI0032EC889A
MNLKNSPAVLVVLLLLRGAVASADDTVERAQEILAQRCVVCHACYDAPCQLKLEAHEGLTRGANKTLVYDSTRLLAGDLTRLFDDAHSPEEWREKGFFPVLDSERPDRGVLRQMLELKRANPLPATGALPRGFDFDLHREQQCPKPGEFGDFAREYPLWGMPYGLPGLHADEHEILTRWLDAGAPPPPTEPLPGALADEIVAWERFLNAPGNKSRLMARYIYEHLFLATLYLVDGDNPHWFRLVRAGTPPGQPIEVIATRRPFDDPGRRDFYYRLQRMPIVVATKSHQPYRFDRARRDWYQQLFLQPEYEVNALPGYDTDTAGNPFVSFASIPVRARYRFLLEDAEFTIMNFIKGPVCRGQIALNVIEDRFWVMFMDPDALDPELDGPFLERESHNLRLPSASTGSVIDLLDWHRYARAHKRYMQAKDKHLQRQYDQQGRKPGLELVWDGDGSNPNAALTIFRHVDTASVVKGFVGDIPKTAWVITYSLLERIHYLLVANFDVFGAVSHQLESRLYMDFLRMEGELNLLLFLPADERRRLWKFWYRDAPDAVRKHQFIRSEAIELESPLDYQSDDPKTEFLGWMRQRIHGAGAPQFDYRRSASPDMAAAFDRLVAARGAHNRFLPAVSFVNVIGGKRDEAYTLLHDAGYSNIAQLFREEERRLPDEDAVTVVAGILGSHPNQFFQIHEKQVPLFVEDVLRLGSEEDMALLRYRYGVRRNSPWFWTVSDRFHDLQQRQDPLAAGVLDYNRYHGY